MVVVCMCSLFIQAQNIIPFRNTARTFSANDSVATEAVAPNCSISITENSKALVTYTFENAIENRSQVDGVDYSHLRIKDFGINTRIGCPQLPGYTNMIAVKTDAPTVRIVSSDYVEYTGFDIFPAQIPETESDTATYPFIKDSIVYATNAFYPQNLVEVQDVQKYRGTPLALVRVNPVQYNPVTHTIRCHSNIVYELDSALTEEDMAAAMPYEVVTTSEDSDTEETLYYTSPDKYIIVTTNKYKSTLSSFIQSKQELGYKVVVLCKDSWSSSAEVKNAIQTEYDKKDYCITRFLLIVGGHEDVPAETRKGWKLYKDYQWIEEGWYPSDHYYSCMDGETDYLPEMARGRLDVNNTTELSAVLQKLIYYNQKQNYTGNATLCGEFECKDENCSIEGKRAIKTNEELRDYLLSYYDYNNIERIYYASEDATPQYYNDAEYGDGGEIPLEIQKPNFTWNGNCANVIRSINSGIDFILYNGHGDIGYWHNNMFKSSDIDSLNNSSMYPFVFSLSCNTGWFFNVMDATNSPECLAASLLKAPNKGAVGVLASSFFSLAGRCDVLAKSIFNSMYSAPGISPAIKTTNYTLNNELDSDTIPKYTMGEAMNKGFISLFQYFDQSTSANWEQDQNIQMFQRYHIFGDPSMGIYTGKAEDLNKVIINQINKCISINTNGIKDCRVILRPINEVDSLSFQMADHLSGIFTFAYNDCDYQIIILKHNCVPVYKTLADIDNVYLQNQAQTNRKSYNGHNIYAGSNVTTEYPTGNYTIKAGAHLELNYSKTVTLSKGFSIIKGGTLEVNKK